MRPAAINCRANPTISPTPERWRLATVRPPHRYAGPAALAAISAPQMPFQVEHANIRLDPGRGEVVRGQLGREPAAGAALDDHDIVRPKIADPGLVEGNHRRAYVQSSFSNNTSGTGRSTSCGLWGWFYPICSVDIHKQSDNGYYVDRQSRNIQPIIYRVNTI